MIDSLFFFFCIFFSFPLVFELCRRKYSKIHLTSQNLSSASISSFYVYFIYYVTLFQINMKWKSRGNSTWYVINIHRGFRCEHMINGISLSFMFPCAYWLKIIFLNENESKEYNTSNVRHFDSLNRRLWKAEVFFSVCHWWDELN